MPSAARINTLICSLYSLTLLMSWSSGTIVCRYHPIPANIQFQMPAPIVVYNMNFQKDIFAKPAGMDINWRTTGIRRPVSVAITPWS